VVAFSLTSISAFACPERKRAIAPGRIRSPMLWMVATAIDR
jgi:hypothetical protein